jgi:DNA-binding protein HU-beta
MINKKQLIDLLYKKFDNQHTKKIIQEFLDGTLEIITQSLSDGNSINLVKFGTFKTKERTARIGRNPITGDKINIPATQVVSFKPGLVLKNQVKKQEATNIPKTNKTKSTTQTITKKNKK